MVRWWYPGASIPGQPGIAGAEKCQLAGVSPALTAFALAGLVPQRLVPLRERLLHGLDNFQPPSCRLLPQALGLVRWQVEPRLELADDFPDDVRGGRHPKLRLQRVRVGQHPGRQADVEHIHRLHGAGSPGASRGRWRPLRRGRRPGEILVANSWMLIAGC